ncbi:MAG: class I SAM-dependent methyltransferase [Verrucomicrobiales bacterium]
MEEIALKPVEKALPDAVHDLLDEAEKRAEAFYEAGLGPRFYRYVPSDPLVVYRAMEFLQEEGVLRGNRFCELGCGFGIAAGLASLLGFRATGIEWEADLADRASSLMEHQGLAVEILEQSYLPEGYESCEGMGGKDLVVPGVGRGGGADTPMYDGLDPAEVDLFFVYPWPDEEEFMRRLFREIGSEGAVLLMYQGEGESSAYLWDEEDGLGTGLT